MIGNVISFLLGIISLEYFSKLPSVLFGLILVGTVFVLIQLPFINRYKCKYCLLTFACGFLWMLLHAHVILDKKFPNELQKKPLHLIGIIASIPEKRINGIRFEIDVIKTIPESLWPNPGKVRVFLKDPNARPGPTVGDKWEFIVKLKRPHSYSNPGSFDIEKHLFQNDIQAEGKIIQFEKAQLLESSIFSHPIDRIRSRIRDNIKTNLINLNHSYQNESNSFYGLITALVIGVKDEITQEQWNVFQKTGTAHLMAISGLHVGLVASFVFLLTSVICRFIPVSFLFSFTITQKTQPIQLKKPMPIIAAYLSLGAALFYAFLAGFSIPTKRSVIMIAFFMIGIFTKRIINPYNAFFASLGLVVLIYPLSTLSMGFWLSFGAVFILLYGMTGRVDDHENNSNNSDKNNGNTKNKTKNKVKTPGKNTFAILWWKWGHAQWVVFLGLIPVSLLFFKGFSLMSPIANIIAIPWVSYIVVPISLMGGLLSLISDNLSAPFLMLAEFSFKCIWPLLEYFANHPYAVYQNAIISESPLILIGVFIGILLVLTPKKFPGKYWGIIGFLPLFFGKGDIIIPKTARITVLDVGQGLSTVVETENHVLVFDTGPKLSPLFDTGDRVVVPFLASHGKNKIDALVISHGDNDHVGGAYSILEKMRVDKIITSEVGLFQEYQENKEDNIYKIDKSNKIDVVNKEINKNYKNIKKQDIQKNIKLELCWVGQKWEWDGIQFEMIHPETIYTKKRNDHSCVLHIRNGQQSMLLTADIEAKSEYKILERMGKRLKSTVMLVPHHGSRTSSTVEFLRGVDPRFAIIPFGYLNQYGHPKSDVVERYKGQGIEVLDTVNGGAITVILENKNSDPIISQYRVENKKYWMN